MDLPYIRLQLNIPVFKYKYISLIDANSNILIEMVTLVNSIIAATREYSHFPLKSDMFNLF